MENVIFSLNATVPIFLVMLIGYLLRQGKMLTHEFVTVANNFNYKITLPALLFTDIAFSNVKEMFDVKYILFCMITTTLCFVTIWVLTELFAKDESIKGSFIQCSFRGSAAVLGVAFIENIYGSSSIAPLMIIGTVPLYNIYSVIVLTYKSNEAVEKNIKGTFINIAKNPIIIGIALGLIVSFLSIPVPMVIEKTLDQFAKMATPLALISIGAGFEGKKALSKIKPTIIASFIKLILQPLFFLPIAIWLGYRNQELIALLIMLGAPTTASCYIMSNNMKNDGVIASSIIVLTTLLSSVTLTAIIYVLKVLQLI